MILFKQPDDVMPASVDFSAWTTLVSETLGVTSDVKIFDSTGVDVTAILLDLKTVTTTQIDAVIQAGTAGEFYTIKFIGITAHYTKIELVGLSVQIPLVPVSSSATHYCNQADIENRIGKANLAQLTNDTSGAADPDPIVLDSILSNIDAVIDAKAGQVYTVPLTMPEPKITQIAIDLTTYAIMLRRPLNMAMPKEWDDANKQALGDLEDISNELLRLSDSQSVASAEANIETPTDDPVVDFYDPNNLMSLY